MLSSLEPKVPENGLSLLFIRFSLREVSGTAKNPPYLKDNHMNSKMFSFGCLGVLCVAPSIAQAPQQTGEVVMKTNIGAFKITSPGDQKSFGKIKMSFKGSCLIVGYEGSAPISVTPGLRVEYRDDKRQRIEYFGQGTITLDGKFRAIQWFGRNLDMNWVGLGICRVYGEFDKNGDTGTFTLKGKKPAYWGTGGMQFVLPPRDAVFVQPKVKINGGG